MRKMLVVCVVLSIFFVQYTFSQQPGSNIDAELKALAAKIKALEEEFKLYKTFYEEKKALINDKYDTAVKAMNNNFIEKKNADEKFNFWIIIIDAFSIAGIIGGLIFIWKKAKGYAEKKIQEKFNTIISDHIESIINLVEKERFEEKIKTGKQITVISDENNTYKDAVVNFLTKFGFKNKQFFSIVEIDDNLNKFKNTDLIIINNFENHITEKNLNKYFSSNTFKMPVIHLIAGQDTIKPIPEIYARSNSLVTLYPRMVELLLYNGNMNPE